MGPSGCYVLAELILYSAHLADKFPRWLEVDGARSEILSLVMISTDATEFPKAGF